MGKVEKRDKVPVPHTPQCVILISMSDSAQGLGVYSFQTRFPWTDEGSSPSQPLNLYSPLILTRDLAIAVRYDAVRTVLELASLGCGKRHNEGKNGFPY